MHLDSTRCHGLQARKQEAVKIREAAGGNKVTLEEMQRPTAQVGKSVFRVTI